MAHGQANITGFCFLVLLAYAVGDDDRVIGLIEIEEAHCAISDVESQFPDVFRELARELIILRAILLHHAQSLTNAFLVFSGQGTNEINSGILAVICFMKSHLPY